MLLLTPRSAARNKVVTAPGAIAGVPERLNRAPAEPYIQTIQAIFWLLVAVAFLIQLIQYVPVTVIGLLLAPSLAKRGQSASATAIVSAAGQADGPRRARGDRGGIT